MRLLTRAAVSGPEAEVPWPREACYSVSIGEIVGLPSRAALPQPIDPDMGQHAFFELGLVLLNNRLYIV